MEMKFVTMNELLDFIRFQIKCVRQADSKNAARYYYFDLLSHVRYLQREFDFTTEDMMKEAEDRVKYIPRDEDIG